MAASVFIVREVEALTFDTSNAAVGFVVLSSVGGAQRPREDKRDGQPSCSEPAFQDVQRGNLRRSLHLGWSYTCLPAYPVGYTKAVVVG